MIVVKLEMWPGGDGSRAREIGRTYIYRNGGAFPSRGDYEIRVCRRGHFRVKDAASFVSGEGFTRTARIENFPRLSYNVWRLILRCLKAAFPEEK